MKNKLFQIFSILSLVGIIYSSDLQYFPDKLFSERQDLDNFRYNWFTKQLNALEEPSIFLQSKDKSIKIYRFTWLRTFHNPVSIRIIINNDNSGILIFKMTSGKGGYDPGKLIINKNVDLNSQTISQFLKLIKKENFWSLKSNKEENGLDGAEWIIEGLNNGKYHLVKRWSPEKGNIRQIGLYFLKISTMKIDEIY